MKAVATYKVNKWEEHTYQEIPPGMKMTKASVEYGFSGDLDGAGRMEYLMFYSWYDPKDPHKAKASYVGLIGFEGKLAGKRGTFALIDNGKFEGGSADSTLVIAEGSGTGALKGIQGTGFYRANQEGFRLELDYRLP